ncbi:MAG: hypothetical protein R3C01_16160 [Planctomycetaceae bacterium]
MAISRTLLANNAARTTTLERNRQVSHLRSLPRLVWTGVLLWAAVSGIGTNLLADDDPATSTTPATPATSADAEEATSPRTVYLPYRNLAEVLKEHGATAIVPYEDYLRMIDESQQKPGPAVPVDAVITKATYRGAVAGDVARITATYHITVLGNPWIELPLDFGNAAIGKVSAADKKQVMLRGMGAGKYGLLIGEAGDVQVTFELVTPIKTSPDGREFALSIPSVGISTIEFSVPEKDQSVRILEAIVQSAAPPKATEVAEGDAANGDSPVKPADAVDDADETRVLATLGGSRTISARWHPKSGMKPEMDLLSSVVNRQQISIEDGLIHRDAWLTFQILRGSTNSLEFSVPTGQRILDVSADARVKSWKATDEQGRQLVLVELLTPADKEVTLEVHTEETLPAGPFFLGGISETGFVRGIHAVGAVRENGQVAVSVSNDLMLTIVDQQGVSRIDNGTADNRLRGEGRQTWKYYTPQFQLSATVAQIQPRVVVEQASRLTFTPDELQLVANLDFTVERAGLFDVKLRLPSQFSVDDVQCDAMQERSINPAGDLLSIRLKEKTLGQFRIIVQGHRTLAMAENDVEQDLPLLEPLNVERETGTIHVYAPAAIEVATNEKELQAVQPAPSPPGLRNGEALLTSAWTYSRRPVRIPVKTTRKPTRLSVQIATVVDVQPEVIEVTTHLDALVEFAGIDTFQFLVPADVSDRVQIDVPANDNTSSPIKQKSAAPAEKGWVLWTVETQREVLGRQRFQIVYRLTDDAPVHATPVAVGTTPPTPIPATPTPVDSLVPDPTLPTPATPDTTTPEPTPTPSADSSGTPACPLLSLARRVLMMDRIASATSAAAGRPVADDSCSSNRPEWLSVQPRPAVPLTQLSEKSGSTRSGRYRCCRVRPRGASSRSIFAS